jgi:hypothetical protein
MLDTYVTNRLAQWANWRARRLDGGTGYPKKSAFVINPGGGFWTPDMDSQCVEVDKAVCVLMPERKDAIMQCYTTTGTKEQKQRSAAAAFVLMICGLKWHTETCWAT